MHIEVREKMIHATTKTPEKLAKAGSLSRRAYVTFLAGDGDYVKGVVGLAKGLRKAKSVYPLVVAVLPDVPQDHRRLLVCQGCLVCEIEPLEPPKNQKHVFAWDYYVLNYSKLRMWKFVEHSKMVYLDADTQVFDNIDNLFDLPDGYVYGVVDCLCGMGKQGCLEKVVWPKDLGHEPPIYFNAGGIVFEPNLSTYNDMLRALEVTPPTAYAEQDFLNMFFRDVYKPMPHIYNLMVAMLWRHPDKVEVEKAKVIHYCASGAKPWRYTGKEENMDRQDIRMLVQKWWDIYNDETLDYEMKSVAAGDDQANDNEAIGLMTALHVTNPSAA